MSRASDINLNKSLEDARKLQATLDAAKLYIVESQKQFDSRTTTEDETIRIPLAFADGSGLVDPVAVSADVKAQLVSTNSLLFRQLLTLLDRLSFVNSNSNISSRRPRISILRSSSVMMLRVSRLRTTKSSSMPMKRKSAN